MSDSRFWIGEADKEEDLDGWYTVVDTKIDNIIAFTWTLTAAQVIMHALASSKLYLDEVEGWEETPTDETIEDVRPVKLAKDQ